MKKIISIFNCLPWSYSRIWNQKKMEFWYKSGFQKIYNQIRQIYIFITKFTAWNRFNAKIAKFRICTVHRTFLSYRQNIISLVVNKLINEVELVWMSCSICICDRLLWISLSTNEEPLHFCTQQRKPQFKINKWTNIFNFTSIRSDSSTKLSIV